MNHITKCLAIIFSLLALTSCATGYHYQESWQGDGGFNDERLHPEYPIYDVRASCNGYTSSQRCSDIALRRAADICSDEYYDGFTVINRNNRVSQSHGQMTYHTMETARTTVHSSYLNNYGYHGYGNAYATTTYQVPHTIDYTITKPKTNMTIGCLKKHDYGKFSIVYDNDDVLSRTEYLVE